MSLTNKEGSQSAVLDKQTQPVLELGSELIGNFDNISLYQTSTTMTTAERSMLTQQLWKRQLQRREQQSVGQTTQACRKQRKRAAKQEGKRDAEYQRKQQESVQQLLHQL